MEHETIDDYNHQIADLKQMLDELGNTADICFNLVGTVNLVKSTIESLPMARISGQTILKAGCVVPCEELRANLQKLHERVLYEIDHYQITLQTLTGGDDEMGGEWIGGE